MFAPTKIAKTEINYTTVSNNGQVTKLPRTMFVQGLRIVKLLLRDPLLACRSIYVGRLGMHLLPLPPICSWKMDDSVLFASSQMWTPNMSASTFSELPSLHYQSQLAWKTHPKQAV